MKYMILKIASIYDGHPNSVDSEVVSHSIKQIYSFSSKKAAITYIQSACHSAIDVYRFSIKSPVVYVNGISEYYAEIIINRNIANDYVRVTYRLYSQADYEIWLEDMMDEICSDEHESELFDGLNEHYTSKLEWQIMDVYVGYSRSYNGENYDKDLHEMYYLALQ